MFYYAPDSINYFFKGFFKGLLFVHHTQWFRKPGAMWSTFMMHFLSFKLNRPSHCDYKAWKLQDIECVHQKEERTSSKRNLEFLMATVIVFSGKMWIIQRGSFSGQNFKESIHSFFCGIRSKDPVDRVMITNIITTIWHIQGQHTRKLPPFILIVLMAGVVTGQRSVNSKRDCLVNEYWSGGLCCDKCAPGYKLIKKCSIGMQSQCEKCSDGTYQDSMNYFPNCFRCQKCSKRHAVVTSPCTYQNNTVCGCQTGYRIRFLDGHLQQFRGLSWDCVPYSL
ncbi:uncharacterized protein [Pseudorasbora parva]|uniref:uncharacterized protein isoform X2 n=1 Tax=Pseudorasbora parva TaxID=51549 RepID=UPI00351DB25D